MNRTEQTFSRLTGELDYPMLIVTTAAGEERSGCLVGFSTQCSIDPPRFLVCISDKNHTYAVAGRAVALAVHFPPPTALELARLFGSHTEDHVDKFAHCRWRNGPHGMPILEDCTRWFVGTILDRRRLGDHAGFLLEPVAVADAGEPANLTFSQTKQLEPGHEA